MGCKSACRLAKTRNCCSKIKTFDFLIVEIVVEASEVFSCFMKGPASRKGLSLSNTSVDISPMP